MDDFDFALSARADAGDFNDPEVDDSGSTTKKTGKKSKAAPAVHRPATVADTPEQTAIIQALATTPPGQVLKVVSYSGTGKTSTAIRLTEAYPDWCFFYLAYNADIAKDAKKRFPDNTVVKTTHGWAFGVLGIKDWLNVKRLGNIRRWELAHWMKARRLDPKLPTGATLNIVAADVLATVRRFTQSADPAITRRHAVPNQDKTDPTAFLKVALRQAPDAPTAERNGAAAWNRYRDWLAEKAQAVWQSLIDPEDGSLPLEHDVYLKLLQLQGYTTDYHVVIVDEFQDSNACVMDLFVKQPGIKVAIYDPNQAIYQFRGAKDLASGLPGTQKPLSQSFRFGDAIAECANRVLAYQPAHYGGFIPLRGTPGIDSRIGAIDLPPYTVICRSNRGVFEQALIAVQAGLRINSGAKDLEAAIGYVESAWSLLTGTRIPKMDAEMQEFADGATLREESKADPSLKWVVKLCDEHVEDLPGLCEKLRAAKTHQKRSADVLLITAHRSKGLEFNQVRLANDFTALDNDLLRAMEAMRNSAWTEAETILQKLPVAELNLLYVALTRARVTLQPNQTLEFLDALTPVLARLQAKAEKTSVTDDRPAIITVSPILVDRPTLAASANPDAYRRAQEAYQAFLPELQDALKIAALRDHWTQTDWIEHVESMMEGIAESGYSPDWIQAAAHLYRATPKNSQALA